MKKDLSSKLASLAGAGYYVSSALSLSGLLLLLSCDFQNLFGLWLMLSGASITVIRGVLGELALRLYLKDRRKRYGC